MDDLLFMVIWTIHNIPFITMVPVPQMPDEKARSVASWHMGQMLHGRMTELARQGCPFEPMAVVKVYRVGNEPMADGTTRRANEMVHGLRRRKKDRGLPSPDDIDPRHPDRIFSRPIGNWTTATAGLA